jgi:hypothetical protein
VRVQAVCLDGGCQSLRRGRPRCSLPALVAAGHGTSVPTYLLRVFGAVSQGSLAVSACGGDETTGRARRDAFPRSIRRLNLLLFAPCPPRARRPIDDLAQRPWAGRSCDGRRMAVRSQKAATELSLPVQIWEEGEAVPRPLRLRPCPALQGRLRRMREPSISNSAE